MQKKIAIVVIWRYCMYIILYNATYTKDSSLLGLYRILYIILFGVQVMQAYEMPQSNFFSEHSTNWPYI